jgi:hypothetical protein
LDPSGCFLLSCIETIFFGLRVYELITDSCLFDMCYIGKTGGGGIILTLFGVRFGIGGILVTIDRERSGIGGIIFI